MTYLTATIIFSSGLLVGAAITLAFLNWIDAIDLDKDGEDW